MSKSAAKLINECIKLKRAGIPLRLTASASTALRAGTNPDNVAVGRFTTRSGECHSADLTQSPELRTRSLWHAPRRLVHPIRMGEMASKRSARGFAVDARNHHDIQAWSEGEHSAATILRADRRVDRILSQQPTVPYVDDDGVERETRFDFFVQLKDGTKIVVPVKRGEPHDEFKAFVRRLLAQGHPRGYADMIFPINEMIATEDRVLNAREMLTARENYNRQNYIEALHALKDIRGQVTLHELLRHAADPATRRTALFCLIYEEVLVAVGGVHERIADYTFMSVNHDRLQQELDSNA